MLGVLPLAIARGAGSEMRQAIGVAGLGGMLGVTLFGIVLTPVFFAVVDRVTHGRLARHPWVVAAGDGLMYVVRFGFVKPLALPAKALARARGERVPRRPPVNPR